MLIIGPYPEKLMHGPPEAKPDAEMDLDEPPERAQSHFIVVLKDGDEYRATEQGTDFSATGATPQLAVMAYAWRAHERAQEKLEDAESA